jgi:hypothetical protein
MAPVIVRRTTDRLICITQPDHAALAAHIMRHWRLDGLPGHPRRDAILAATHNHDDGWKEEDGELHLNDHGEPLDFVAVPAAVKQRIWPRAAERVAAAASPYVGALVAQHALTIHAPLRQQEEWRRFFHTMEGMRGELIAQASIDLPTLLGDYPFVRTGDQLSLIFCNGWTSPLSGVGYRAILKGITLEIMPDPFDGIRVPLQVHGRTIAARTYDSAADLRRELEAAPALLLDGAAVGAGTGG